jgi:hypothetical protein
MSGISPGNNTSDMWFAKVGVLVNRTGSAGPVPAMVHFSWYPRQGRQGRGDEGRECGRGDQIDYNTVT